MSFDLIEFLSKVALSLFGKEGASNASIIGLLGFIAFWNIKKHLDKKRAERKEKAKKIVSVKRMGSHEEEISVILENILKKLYSNEVVRAAVMQISNGGEFMNKVSMLKLHMTYEERVNIHIKPIRDRYNQVMINGKYDKLFKKIYISVKCLLEIAEIETMQYEFAEDLDNYIFFHMLYTDNGDPMGIIMISFEDIQKIDGKDIITEDHLNRILYNDIHEIEKILKS